MRLLINRANGTMWHSPMTRMVRIILVLSNISICEYSE